jgi:hypothetical protein
VTGPHSKAVFPLDVIVETIKDFEERKAWPILERRYFRISDAMSHDGYFS